MIVVDYLELKKYKIAFSIAYIKYNVYKKRRDLELKRIESVYPDCASIKDIPNQEVIKNIKYLMQMTKNAKLICDKKFNEYDETRLNFMAKLIG